MFKGEPHLFCLLTVLAPVVVFHRLYDEWEMGPELPFPGGIRDAQHVNVVLSYVDSELKLQRGRRLLHHRNNHHLLVWTR